MPKPTKTPTPPGEPNLPTPIPSRVPEAPEVAANRARLNAFRKDVATSFQSVLKEATSSQRKLLEGIEPTAVESIGTVGGRTVSGRTFSRAPGLSGVLQKGLQFLGVVPQSGIRIASQGRTTPVIDTVRHETAHAILFKQGVRPPPQHDILDLTRVRPDKQIDLPSLKAAKQFKTGTTSQEKHRGFNTLRKRRVLLHKRK